MLTRTVRFGLETYRRPPEACGTMSGLSDGLVGRCALERDRHADARASAFVRHVPVLSREFLDYKGVESGAALSINKEILVRKAFEQYFATGGFPAVAGLSRQLRTKTGREVDFIVPIRGDPRTLLQVCVSLAESRLRIRQTTALSEVM